MKRRNLAWISLVGLLGCLFLGNASAATKWIKSITVNNGLAQAVSADVLDVQAFNVQAAAYGAKGDGVTDDTVAIQNACNDALAANGEVFFPPPSPGKTYLITSTINLNGSGTTTRCVRLRAPPTALNHGQIITYNGPSNSSVFAILGITDSQFENIGVCLQSGLSNVVVWDYQFSATFGTTGSFNRHQKCNTVFVNNLNCIWMRLGQGGGASSGYNVVCDHCLAHDPSTNNSGTIAVQIGGSQNYATCFRHCTFTCSCNLLCGPIASYLTSAVAATDTTVAVADTLLFPASGTISIGGNTATYTSKSVAFGAGLLNLSAQAGFTAANSSQVSQSVSGQGVYAGNFSFLYDGGELCGNSMGYDVLVLAPGYGIIKSLQCQNPVSTPRRFLQTGVGASSAAAQVQLDQVTLKNYQAPADGNGVFWTHWNTILELNKVSATTGTGTGYSSTSNAWFVNNSGANGLGRIKLRDCALQATFPFVNAGVGTHGPIGYEHVQLTNSSGTPQSVLSENPYAYVAVTAATYTALTSDYTIACNCTSNAIAVNLPAANSVPPGYVYEIKKTDSGTNAATVTAAGTDKIDGAATFALSAQYATIRIRSDGVSNWLIFSKI